MEWQQFRAVATSFAVATILFSPDPVAAQQKTQATQLLAIGIQLGHLREFVAKGMGFYDEEGLDVTLQPAPGSATEIQYMTAGRGTLGSIDMHMAVEQRKLPQGLKMRAVFANLQAGVYRIATIEGRPIKGPQDFKGKTFGVPTQASGSFPFLIAVAKQAGVAENDMTIVPVGFGPSSADALIRGRVDAISTVFTAVNDLRFLNRTQNDWKLAEIVVPQNAWPTNAMMISDDEARNKRPMIVGMLRAFAKGHLFVDANPEAALKVAQKLYPELVRDADMPRQLQLLKWSMEESYSLAKYKDKPIGYFDLEAWAGTEQYYKAAGLIGPDDSLKDVIDTSFLAEINNFDKDKIRRMAAEYK
jgi:NitT/TauT family transport system substrate-binding protein